MAKIILDSINNMIERYLSTRSGIKYKITHETIHDDLQMAWKKDNLMLYGKTNEHSVALLKHHETGDLFYRIRTRTHQSEVTHFGVQIDHSKPLEQEYITQPNKQQLYVIGKALNGKNKIYEDPDYKLKSS